MNEENRVTKSEVASVKNAARRRAARAAGKCCVCLKRKVKEGRTRCPYCIEQHRVYYYKTHRIVRSNKAK